MRALTRALLAVLVAASLASTPVLVAPARADGAKTYVEVSGTLIAAVSDPSGAASYALALPDGPTLPLDVRFHTQPETPAHWSARIEVPEAVRSRLALPRGRTLTSRSASVRVATALHRMGRTARVISPSPPERTEPAPGPTAHHIYIGILTGLSSGTHPATAISDADAEQLVDQVASYWKGQSNGMISQETVEATPLRYDSSVATAGDCGLGGTGSEWFDMMDEATTMFPAADIDSGDQIVLFVPHDVCDGSSATGMGGLGSSFADGGFSVVSDEADIRLSTVAHEVGHNYGFEHAGLFTCGQAIVTSGCLDQYGDLYDVMGYAVDETAVPALNTPYRVMAGITDAGEVAQADFSAPFTQTWSIQPRSSTAGQRSVHLVDPDTAEDIWLDYRNGGGADAGTAYASWPGPPYAYGTGVVIERRVDADAVDQTAVTPAFVDDRVPLAPGESWHNDSGSLTVSVDSLQDGAAQVTVTYAPSGTDPGAGSVSLSGHPDFEVGSVIEADTNGWAAGATFTYTWLRDGAEIPNAGHDDQFTPTVDDVGHDISVIARGSYTDGGWVHTVTSASVRIEPGAIPVTKPTVSGTPRVGSELDATAGTLGAIYTEVSWTWQWQADGTDIPRAWDDTFTPTKAQAGKTIRACQELTADGYKDTTSCSTATGPVTGGTEPPVTITPAPKPTLTGTPKVGRTLTGRPGTWDSGATLKRQWLVGGSVVSGITGSTFRPRPRDAGKKVTFRVTATKGSVHVTRSVTSARVAKGTLASATPRIKGKAKVKRTLKVTTGRWTTGTRLTYSWYANGKRIKKATKPSLKLTKAMKGKRITVRVTGTKPGYATVSRTSRATAKVRRK
ncbi:MAG TPA: hypothetical protein VF426_03385 [Marmoricola sp.]